MIKLSEILDDVYVRSKKTGKKYDVKKFDSNKHDWAYDYRGSKENPNPFTKKKSVKEELEGDEVPMVDGIVEIVRMVKDMNNRMEIAKNMITKFKQEGIDFDYNKFLSDCGLKTENQIKEIMIKLTEIFALPKDTEKEIEASVKMGFNKIQVGLISPKKKGVMLMNKKYEVRGVYPIEFKKVIEYIVDKYT